MFTNILETVLQKELPENNKKEKVLAINLCSDALIERAYTMSKSVDYARFQESMIPNNYEYNYSLKFTFSDKCKLFLTITNEYKYLNDPGLDQNPNRDNLDFKTNSIQILSSHILQLNKEIDNLKKEIIAEKDNTILELENKIKELENNSNLIEDR